MEPEEEPLPLSLPRERTPTKTAEKRESETCRAVMGATCHGEVSQDDDGGATGPCDSQVNQSRVWEPDFGFLAKMKWEGSPRDGAREAKSRAGSQQERTQDMSPTGHQEQSHQEGTTHCPRQQPLFWSLAAQSRA